MKLRNILILSLLISFAILSKFEDRGIIRNLDFAVTVKVQDKIDKSVHLRLAAVVDNIMEGSSFFAGPVVTSIAVLILTGIAFRRRKWQALLIPVLFIMIVLVELYGKSLIHHPSPPFAFVKHPTTIFPASYINEQFSYPSGHAARSVFLAILVWFLLKKRWVGVVMACYFFVVALGKIYLGQHWFSDVAGGALLGAGFGLLTMTFISPIMHKQ